MTEPGTIDLSTGAILRARPPKNAVDAEKPYAFFAERECSATGEAVDVATIFLANRECPWRCLMCDLWKNTTDDPVPPAAVPRQIDYALARLPPARQVKLYNSGNFFDSQAVRPADHGAIAARVSRFERVIVENHPKLVGESCLRFRDACGTALEVAMGLETVHPQILPRLNKGMTLDDFSRAVEFLLKHGMGARAFILLRPPFLNEDEGIEWAMKSLDYAISLGVGCCSVIPTRAGNGIMERLAEAGLFVPPTIRSLERVLDYGLSLARGRETGQDTPCAKYPLGRSGETYPSPFSRPRVFADLWDIERFYDCAECGPRRAERIAAINLSQRRAPQVSCRRCG